MVPSLLIGFGRKFLTLFFLRGIPIPDVDFNDDMLQNLEYHQVAYRKDKGFC